jgi:hypothetical protein
VLIARDTIRRIRELSRATKDLYDELAALVKQVAPQLLAEPGIGVLLAAKFIGEIAGIDRWPAISGSGSSWATGGGARTSARGRRCCR